MLVEAFKLKGASVASAWFELPLGAAPTKLHNVSKLLSLALCKT